MYIQSYFTAKLSFNYVSELRHKIYNLILSQAYQSDNLQSTSDLIINLTDDTEKIKEMIFSIVSELIPGSIMIICTLLYAFWINFYLSILILILVPVISLIINFFTKLIKERSQITQNSISDVYSVINQNFSNFLIIKTKGLEKEKLKEYIQLETEYKNNGLKVINYISMQPSLINIIQVTGICIIACFGSYQVFTDKSSMAELLSFGTSLSLTIEPAIFITKSLGIIEKSKVSYKNIKSTMNILSETGEKYGVKYFTDHFSIVLKNVSFKYSQSDFKINNLNLTINQGETIAFTGINGSGKSTLIKILLRHIDNYQGIVEIGNINIKDYSKQELRNNISASFHDPLLFNTSIKENIIWGYSNKNNLNDILNKVCQITMLSDFLNTFEESIDYIVGEGGNKLSTGQKQKVSIARAIINQPKILVLDEATSAIDLKSEEFIYKEIRNFLPDSIIIIINHRKESINFIANQNQELHL